MSYLEVMIELFICCLLDPIFSWAILSICSLMIFCFKNWIQQNKFIRKNANLARLLNEGQGQSCPLKERHNATFVFFFKQDLFCTIFGFLMLLSPYFNRYRCWIFKIRLTIHLNQNSFYKNYIFWYDLSFLRQIWFVLLVNKIKI
jgi:hypothetical protein